jgi:hypothetical protein
VFDQALQRLFEIRVRVRVEIQTGGIDMLGFARVTFTHGLAETGSRDQDEQNTNRNGGAELNNPPGARTSGPRKIVPGHNSQPLRSTLRHSTSSARLDFWLR